MAAKKPAKLPSTMQSTPWPSAPSPLPPYGGLLPSAHLVAPGTGGAPYSAAPTVVAGPAMQVRKRTLAFPPLTLAPGVPAKVTTRPQMPFRGEKIVIGSPDDVVVHGVRVGNIDQMAGPGPVPGKAISGVPMQMDTCNVAQDITLVVSSAKGGPFAAAVLGVSADDGRGGEPPFDTVVRDEPDPLVAVAEAALKHEDEAYEPGVTLDELKDAGWDVSEDE